MIVVLGQTGPLGKNTPLSDFGLQEVDSVPTEWLEGSPIPGGFFPVIGAGDGDMLPAQRRKMRHDITPENDSRGILIQALPGNWQRLTEFRKNVLWLWHRTLRRRSNRTRWTWNRFRTFLVDQIPEVRILHPYPNVRFAAKHPR
jgi:hypothetical protein